MKHFPNGFTSWQESHYEIVAELTRQENNLSSKISKVVREAGTGGLYELAEDLTDRFEKLCQNKQTDGNFFDLLEEFLNKEL